MATITVEKKEPAEVVIEITLKLTETELRDLKSDLLKGMYRVTEDLRYAIIAETEAP